MDDKQRLLEPSEWEPDPPGGSTYTDENSQDDTTRNPHLQPGQPPVWLNAIHPDARPDTIEEILAPYGSPQTTIQARKAPPGHIDLGCCHVKAIPFNVFIAVLTTVFAVGLSVTLPIYNEYVVTAGSDPYIIIVWVGLWTCTLFFTFNIGTIIVSKLFQRDGGKPWKSILPHAPWGVVIGVGVSSSLNSLLVVYASNPQRTPGYLQALLACMNIPFTIVIRYFFLRRGVSTIRMICCFMVLVGLFIASEPVIFELTSGRGDPTRGTTHHSLAYRIMWPLCFAIAMAPMAMSNVLIEKGCKKEEVCSSMSLSQLSGVYAASSCFKRHMLISLQLPSLPIAKYPFTPGWSGARMEDLLSSSMPWLGSNPRHCDQQVQNVAFLSWTGLFQCVILLSLFWTDLIHGFGLADNIHEFSDHMKIGFECHVGLRDSCRHLVYIPWIFIGFYMLTNFTSFLLTRYAEGAVYTSVVSSLATPIASLFWSIFSSNPFRYNPEFTVVTAYTLSGLALMVPGTMIYNYFASKEEKEQRENPLWKDIWSEDEIYREN